MGEFLLQVSLLLDEPLLRRLEEAARREGVDLSSLLRRMLCRQVAQAQMTVDAAAEIQRLRESLPPMPDSTPAVRAARDGSVILPTADSGA